MRAVALIAVALIACKGKEPAPAPKPKPVDAGVKPDAASAAWPHPLAEFPLVEPVRVIGLPAKVGTPRFDVGGPVIVGDVAVVSSSQFGFAAADWRRGQLVWTKPAGDHVAPPVAKAGSAILIGDCVNPPDVPDGERLLGCVRVVTASGADESYAAIHGKADVKAFAAEPGPQKLWLDGDRAVRWRRGDQAVRVDLITGVAKPASIDPPPVHVVYKDHAWEISQAAENRLVAREHGKIAWQTRRPYTALVGAVYLAEQAPMVRAFNIGVLAGIAELNLFDIDATGSLHGQVAFPVPTIGALGYAINEVGDTAIALRMDATLHHDFIAGYAANALLIYVYPLPEVPRADPVGVAVAPDAVIAFHDGDTITILPELSAPPTAPGAPKRPDPASSQIPTP